MCGRCVAVATTALWAGAGRLNARQARGTTETVEGKMATESEETRVALMAKRLAEAEQNAAQLAKRLGERVFPVAQGVRDMSPACNLTEARAWWVAQRPPRKDA